MVALGIIAVTIVVGSTTYSFGIFVTPVSKELNLSRSTMNLGLICQHLGTACLAPVVGRLLDRYSIRSMMAVSAVFLGGGFIVMSIGDTLWLKGIMLALPVAFAIAGAGTLACYVLVARWFTINRGRAMALVAIGQSASSILFAPLLAYVVQQLGWRQALIVEGIFVCAVLLLLSRLIGDHPTADEREASSDRSASPSVAAEERHLGQPTEIKKVLATPLFWMLAAIIGITLAVIQALLATMVPLFIARGYSPVAAASLISMLGFSGICGKIALAIIADRINRVILLGGCVLITLGFTLSLLEDRGYIVAAFAAFSSGIAIGTVFPICSTLIAERFGANSLGTVEGMMTPVIAISSAVAIHFAGRSFDTTGDYTASLLTFAAALASALLLALAFRFYRSPEYPQPLTS
jgi:sugar phosphate permease